MALDPSQPLNASLPGAAQARDNGCGGQATVGIANPGFWGIRSGRRRITAPVLREGRSRIHGTAHRFHREQRRATVQASAQVPGLTAEWKRYAVTLTTGKGAVSATKPPRRSAQSPGTVWFKRRFVVPTDLERSAPTAIAATHATARRYEAGVSAFSRWQLLQGHTLATRFDWKKTLGDIAQRPGHRNDAWNYWSTDGMGLLEFLLWCEDMNAQPVLGVFAGFRCAACPRRPTGVTAVRAGSVEESST